MAGRGRGANLKYPTNQPKSAEREIKLNPNIYQSQMHSHGSEHNPNPRIPGQLGFGALNFSNNRSSQLRPDFDDNYPDVINGHTNSQRELNQENQENEQLSGPYMLITPNTEKRSKLLQQREANLQQYEQLKKENSMKYKAEGPSTLGGQKLSKEELLKRREQDQKQAEFLSRNKALERQRKREATTAEKRKMEDKEINERKQKAREQAERNKEKERRSQEERKAKMDHDRRCNLDALEKKLKREARIAEENKIMNNLVENLDKSFSDLSIGASQLSDDRQFKKLVKSFPNIQRDVLHDIYVSSGKSYVGAISILNEQ